MGKLELPPFDAPCAQTEIVAGALTEYSGRGLALFHLARQAGFAVGLTLIAAFYLGGTADPLAWLGKTLVSLVALARLADAAHPAAYRPDCWALVALRSNAGAGSIARDDRCKGMGMSRIGTMLRDVIRSLFRRAATGRYPFKRSPAPDRLRGRLTWNPEKCTGCCLCSMDCPSNAIELIVVDKDGERFVMRYHVDQLHVLRAVRPELPVQMPGNVER